MAAERNERRRGRRGWVLALMAALAVVLTAALGAATNIGTGLPFPSSWTWVQKPSVMWSAGGALVLILTVLAVVQQRLAHGGDEAAEAAPSVTATTISGIVSTGDGATIVQHQGPTVQLPDAAWAAPATITAPTGLMNIPAWPGVFVGRHQSLARLDTAMAGTGGVVVQAVHGLGGIGKSSLAAQWAMRHRGLCNPIWWIDAETPAGIDAGLAGLSIALQPGLSGALPLEALRERALQWLVAHDGWLLILDNVSDPVDVAPMLSRVTTGRFLLTSRRATGWAGVATPVPLDVLSADEAVELMTGILTHDGRPLVPDGLADVCEELGCLPLAVEQAAAYLAETRLTARQYLQLLADNPATMYGHTGESQDGERTISRIWQLTLGQLDDEPLCGQILRILAWYAPDNIPRRLFDELATAPAVHHAIGRLAAYSMLTADAETLRVHRLVQAVARTADPDDPHRRPAEVEAARTAAAELLAKTLPDRRVPAHWPTWRSLLPHINALSEHTSADTDNTTMTYLINDTAMLLRDHGNLDQAIAYLLRASAGHRRILGADHPDTLTVTDNLACAYRSVGDVARAVPLHEQNLADRRRLFGPDHPDTLSSTNNLAGAYRSAGDLRRAIVLHKQNLADRRRVLGTDHPDTLVSTNNLAGTYRAVGDLSRAIPLYEQNLADRRRLLGPDHPATLRSTNNLAGAYRSAGDLAQAIRLHEQNLADRRRVIGTDHPDTLSSTNNLAGTYRAAGDLGRAIPLYEQNLTDRRRVLGPDHPDTLNSMISLAGAYLWAGDPDRAIPLFEQSAADCRRALGSNHQLTMKARQRLTAAHSTDGPATDFVD